VSLSPQALQEIGLAARVLQKRAREAKWDGRRAIHRTGWIVEADRFLGFSTLDLPRADVRLMFTRDTGHHTSGWMKNPQYERCWHLSISRPAGPTPKVERPAGLVSISGAPLTALASAGHPLPLPVDLERAIVRAFYGDNEKHVWRESAKSTEGRARGVWHYRVFADRHWQPITPRGEVYSTELTELGWKSWSELGAEIVSTVDPS